MQSQLKKNILKAYGKILSSHTMQQFSLLTQKENYKKDSEELISDCVDLLEGS